MMKPGEPLSERVAIVTGGGRGLGRAMTLGLASMGCRVVITGAREQHEVAAVAREGGANIHALVADVTHEEDCARVVDSALSHFGRLDILVNNAARGMKYVSERFLTERPDVFRMCDRHERKRAVPDGARRTRPDAARRVGTDRERVD
jgi:NAD(P)-dependent dehydrogenase (short-subunit alcohol dehydrogenase family)